MPLPTYLPDTNIIIHLVRQDVLFQRISAQYPLAPTDPSLTLSSVIVGEVLAFAKRNNWGQIRRNRLENFLLQCDIVPLEEPGLVDAYVELEDYSRKVGRTMGDHDLWIAATAQVMNATLLTTDKDFDHLFPTYLSRDWLDPNTR